MGFIFTFFVVGFGVGLGGDSRDLWKVIVYPLLWPFTVPYILTKGG